MCFICKLTFEHFILLREVLNYVQSDDARTGVCSPYKLVSHTSVGCLCQAISSRFEVEVSSLYTLCKKKKKKLRKVIVCLLICTWQSVCALSPRTCWAAWAREWCHRAGLCCCWAGEPAPPLPPSADPVVLGIFREARSVALMTLLQVKLSPN